jgi:putative transposase
MVEQFGQPVPGSIPTIIRSFKSTVTKRIHAMRGAAAPPVWQRNYYERIVHNDRALQAIRAYIRNNPLQWALDRDNAAKGLPEASTVDDYWREAGAGTS